MMRREPPSVQLEDRYVKSGDPPGRVWVVVRQWTTIDGLAHVRLQAESREGETRIISVSALTDRQFYSPAAPKPVR